MKLLLALALCAATVLGQGGFQAQTSGGDGQGGGGASASLQQGGASGQSSQQGQGGGQSGQQSQGGGQSGQQQQGGGSSPNVDTAAIFKALTIDRCTSPCVKQLEQSITQSLKFQNLWQNAMQTCDASSQCQQSCINIKTQMLPQLALSGVQQLCDPQTRQKLKAQQSCIQPVIDQIAQQCNSQSNFAQSVAQFSNAPAVKQGFNPIGVLKELGPICQTSPVFFTCLRINLNQKCPGAGSTITEAFAKPFYQIAQFVSQRGQQLQELIKQQYLPPQCGPLTDTANIDKIWKDSNSDQAQQQQGSGQQSAQQNSGQAQSNGQQMQSQAGGM